MTLLVEPQEKLCRGCNLVLPRSRFHRCSKHKTGIQSKCKKCQHAMQKANYAKTASTRTAYARQWREKNYEKTRAAHRRHRYGITDKQYQLMFERQNGRCCICFSRPGKVDRLNLDHSHLTGCVRGLLCGPCNRMLGHAKDNPITLSRAAEYLRSWSVSE